MKTDKEFKALARKATKFPAELPVVRSKAQYHELAAQRAQAVAVVDKIEEKRLAITTPLNAALKETNKQAREAKAGFDHFIKSANNRLAEWTIKEDEKREKKAAKLIAAGKTDEALAVVEDTTSNDDANVKYVHRWTGQVEREELVPAYFDGKEVRKINQPVLNELARKHKEKLDIPGVKAVKIREVHTVREK